jgi:hypothetical protein
MNKQVGQVLKIAVMQGLPIERKRISGGGG